MAVAVFLCGGLWFLRARTPPNAGVAPEAMQPRAADGATRSPPRAGATPIAAAVAGTPARVGNGPAATPPTAGPEHRVSVINQTAADYRRRARYPRSSQPLADGEEDRILRARTVSPNVSHGPDGEEPSLTVFPDRMSFQDPDPVVIYAYLSVAGAHVAASDMNGEVTDGRGNVIAPLAFRDDGANGDAASGGFVYTATLAPTAARDGGLSGPYAVSVHAWTEDGQERFGTTGFLYSHPDAELTGQYTDAVVDGSLQVNAQVAVGTAGRFHLEATLYTQAGRPLAWAQNALQLGPGDQWIPLSFYGLILREKGDDGPYVLRYVALSTTTGMPNAKNRLVENAYVTSAYSAGVFSDQPFNDPNLLETAERMESDTSGGTPLDGGP